MVFNVHDPLRGGKPAVEKHILCSMTGSNSLGEHFKDQFWCLHACLLPDLPCKRAAVVFFGFGNDQFLIPGGQRRKIDRNIGIAIRSKQRQYAIAEIVFHAYVVEEFTHQFRFLSGLLEGSIINDKELLSVFGSGRTHKFNYKLL